MTVRRTYKERAALIPKDYEYRRAVADPTRGVAGIDWTAEELWDFLPEDGAAVVMTSYGHVNGVERFGSEVVAREGDRIVVICTGGDIGRGNVVVAYPLGQNRTVRLLATFEVTACG